MTDIPVSTPIPADEIQESVVDNTAPIIPVVPEPVLPVEPIKDELVPEEHLTVTTVEDDLVLEDEINTPTESTAVVESEVTTEEKPTDNKPEFPFTNDSVTLQEAIASEFKEEDKSKYGENIPFSPVTQKELEYIVDTDQFNRSGSDGLPDEWRGTFANGLDLLHTNEAMQKAVEQRDQEWLQYIQFNDKVIRPFRPKWKTPDNGSLSGLRAIDKIRSALNQGSTITIPCWASGIWLTIKAPTVLELADNFDLISNEIIELGKQTGGGIFENTQVYLNKNLMDLVTKLFYSWNVNDSDSTESRSLEDMLLVDDLETIAWAIGACMYPNGYPFDEPCVANTENCTDINSQLINLNKIFFVNNSKLTTWQKEFMCNPTTKHSYDEIMKYRLESPIGQTSHVKLKDYPFTVYLKTPTVQEYIDSGYGWINQLKDSIRGIVTNANDTKLNNMLFERAGLTIARGYGHYVSSIVFDDGKRITTREDLNAVIDEICAVPEASTALIEEINKHITNTSVTLVALPRHNCPKCKKEPVDKPFEQHPFLIPVSALKLFFSLRDRKLGIV